MAMLMVMVRMVRQIDFFRSVLSSVVGPCWAGAGWASERSVWGMAMGWISVSSWLISRVFSRF